MNNNNIPKEVRKKIIDKYTAFCGKVIPQSEVSHILDDLERELEIYKSKNVAITIKDIVESLNPEPIRENANEIL